MVARPRGGALPVPFPNAAPRGALLQGSAGLNSHGAGWRRAALRQGLRASPPLPTTPRPIRRSGGGSRASRGSRMHCSLRFRRKRAPGSGTSPQAPIKRCARVTSGGMAGLCDTGLSGLASMGELDRHCDLMSGVAGETITDLLCDQSMLIATRREPLYVLSRDFGRGVQLVNILRDRREDRERGVWAPHGHGRWRARPALGRVGARLQKGVVGLTDSRAVTWRLRWTSP